MRLLEKSHFYGAIFKRRDQNLVGRSLSHGHILKYCLLIKVSETHCKSPKAAIQERKQGLNRRLTLKIQSSKIMQTDLKVKLAF